jgi:hypothetical protein
MARNAVGLAKSVSLRCLRIFVDQPAEDRTVSDLGGGYMADIRTWHGRPLAKRAMGPMRVVMRRVIVEDGRQMPFAGDENPVGALPADGADPPFGEGVGSSRRLPPIELMDSDLFG